FQAEDGIRDRNVTGVQTCALPIFTITGLPENPELIPQNGATPEIAASLTGVGALAWTTTPWTLPTNLSLAAGPDIEYAVVPVERSEERRVGKEEGAQHETWNEWKT